MRDEIINKLKSKKIILFGAGDYARQFYTDFHDSLSIIGCISNNSSEKSLIVNGKEVLPVSRVKEGLNRPADDYFIIICAARHKEMREQLNYMGYTYGTHYIHSDLAYVLLSTKKIALIYGVCYIYSIKECLNRSKAFSSDYYIINWRSYEPWEPVEYEMFLFVLRICDLYLYNSCVSLTEKIKTEELISRTRVECKKIAIPVIGPMVYHPQALLNGQIDNGLDVLDVPENKYNIVSHKTSYGPFYAPDWNINRMLEQGKSVAEIKEIISDIGFYKKEQLEDFYRKQMHRIKIIEKMADIVISDYLEANHGKKRLTLNAKHISNIVIIEFAKRILRLLGYNDCLPEQELLDAELLTVSEVPLYPSVIEGLDLQVYKENSKYKIFTFLGRREVDFGEYVELYCDFCGNMKRYMEMGFFPY